MKLATDNTATRTPRATEMPANLRPGSGYETNYNQRMANLCREEYARVLAAKERLMAAHIAGFTAITVETADGPIVFPLVGARGGKWAEEIYVEMAEILGDKLAKLERDIVSYEQDSQKDEADEREGMGARTETLAFCLPMRRLSDAEFQAMPPEARRAFDERRAGELAKAA